MRVTALLFCITLCAVPAASRAQDSVPTFPTRLQPQLAITVDSVRGSAQSVNQAVEHSDAYYTRLTIHHYGSFIELPLFGAEYLLGQKLITGTVAQGSSIKSAHKIVALGLAGLFTVNTVTGVWNLVESRHDKEGRTTKWLHVGLMLASDAGFAYTGAIASNARRGTIADRNNHRNAALVSIGLATGGTLLMWLR